MKYVNILTINHIRQVFSRLTYLKNQIELNVQ